MDVLGAWGLDGEVVTPVTGGATNETWRVSGERSVAFLRRYRTVDRAAVEREHLIITAVADAGVQTPRLIPASTGQTVVESHGALFRQQNTSRSTHRSPLTGGPFSARSNRRTGSRAGAVRTVTRRCPLPS